MRLIDEASLTALEGSRPADTLTVWAWRDGSLVVPEPLEVINWGEDDDAGDSVKVGGKMSFTVGDPDGSLGAWRLDDPLGVADTELQVIYRIGGAGALNFRKLRLTSNEPSEMVESRLIPEYGYAEPDSDVEPHMRRVYITRSVVKVEAVDLTVDVDDDRFEVPESAQKPTAIAEIARLTGDHFPLVVDPGVTDVKISANLIFDRERLEAIQDLATRVGARYRMGGDGEMHLYSPQTDPVWRVEPTAGLVSVGRKQALSGLYNKWVVEGKDSGDGQPVRATAAIEIGPLRWKRRRKRPFFYSSEMIETYSQAIAYAAELRDTFLSSLAVELSVETVPRPELQAGDRIEVGCPVDGRVAYLPGLITSIRRAGSTVPTGTQLTVSCSYSDVVTALGRTEWAKNLGAGMPALTWDRMPSTWGTLPAITWDSLP